MNSLLYIFSHYKRNILYLKIPFSTKMIGLCQLLFSLKIILKFQLLSNNSIWIIFNYYSGTKPFFDFYKIPKAGHLLRLNRFYFSRLLSSSPSAIFIFITAGKVWASIDINLLSFKSNTFTVLGFLV